VVAAMVVGWLLALVLAFDGHPIYSFYANLAHRPGGISALGDQQLAGGVMWVLGSIAFGIAVMTIVYRWLDPNATTRRRSTALTT
jgi:putative membrane protein